MPQAISSRNQANQAIAAVFNEIANLIGDEEANPFRIHAYRNAARIVEPSTASRRGLNMSPALLEYAHACHLNRALP